MSEMRDVAYLHLLLDEVIERYGLPVSALAIGNIEAKIMAVLQSLVEAGNDTQVGARK
jgi:hypothetical protein